MKNKLVKILTIVFCIVSVFSVLVVPSLAWTGSLVPVEVPQFETNYPRMPDLNLNFLPYGDTTVGRRTLRGWTRYPDGVYSVGLTSGTAGGGSYVYTYDGVYNPDPEDYDPTLDYNVVGYGLELSHTSEFFVDFVSLPTLYDVPRFWVSGTKAFQFGISSNVPSNAISGLTILGEIRYITSAGDSYKKQFTVDTYENMVYYDLADLLGPESSLYGGYSSLSSIQFAIVLNSDIDVTFNIDLRISEDLLGDMSVPVNDIFDFVYDNAYRNGYQAGYNAGLAEGEGSIDQEELDRLLAEARQDGYDTGFEDGQREALDNLAEQLDEAYTSGLTAGYIDGYAGGLAEGRSLGFDEGFSSGYVDGERDGRAEGYDEGYNQGLEDGAGIGDKGFFYWIIESVGAFLDIDLGLGVTIGGIFMTLCAIGLFMFILKMIAGG